MQDTDNLFKSQHALSCIDIFENFFFKYWNLALAIALINYYLFLIYYSFVFATQGHSFQNKYNIHATHGYSFLDTTYYHHRRVYNYEE